MLQVNVGFLLFADSGFPYVLVAPRCPVVVAQVHPHSIVQIIQPLMES